MFNLLHFLLDWTFACPETWIRYFMHNSFEKKLQQTQDLMSKQLLGVVPFVQTQGAFPNCCWKNPVHLTLQEPSCSRIGQSMRDGPSQHVTNQQLETVLENGKKWKDIERNEKKSPALCNSLMSMLLLELHFW